MALKPQHKNIILFSLIAVAAVVILLVVYNRNNPAEMKVKYLATNAGGQLQQVSPNQVLSEGTPTAQVYAPDDTSVGSLSEDQASQLGLYTPEQKQFLGIS